MSKIVVLMMRAQGQDGRQQGIIALGEAGHEVTVVEPRFPDCQRELEGSRADLVIVDASQAPSHGRATAGWLSSVARFRTVPFLFVDVPDKDMARTRKEVARAHFATWSSVVGASERLAKRR
jgi:hypothetical protein